MESLRGPFVYFGGSILAVLAALLLLYCVYLAARALWSLVRSRRCREFAQIAAKKQREGGLAEAVELYLKAESNWSLNSWDGSRESWLSDLEQLGAIGRGIVQALSRDPGTVYADFKATLAEMKEVLRERRNFGFDGRKMLPDVSVRWNASAARLNHLRKRLREVCDPKAVRRS